MLYRHIKYWSDVSSDLPKKLRGKANKQTSTFNTPEPTKPSKILKFPRFIVGFYLLMYFLGYQPTFGIPPIKKSEVYAEFSQEQSINSNSISTPFNLPHPGYVSTHFSVWHPGVDIATGLGMPVKPIAPGKVVEVTFGFIGLGHYVVVEHDGGYRSTYGHMGQVFVKVDDLVTESSILGQVGLTGRTTGPHTHLEVTKDGKSVDPLTLLPKIDDFPGKAYYEARKSVESLVSTLPVANPANQIVKQVIISKITPTPTPQVDLKTELAFDL